MILNALLVTFVHVYPAIIATDLISTILSRQGWDCMIAFTEDLVIAVLGLYLYLLDRLMARASVEHGAAASFQGIISEEKRSQD